MFSSCLKYAGIMESEIKFHESWANIKIENYMVNYGGLYILTDRSLELYSGVVHRQWK